MSDTKAEEDTKAIITMQKEINDLKHKLQHAKTRMSIIQTHSTCCGNSSHKCTGCLSCCG
jgi:hypothetical protein